MDAPGWAQLPHEPATAYTAFSAYVRLGWTGGVSGDPRERRLPTVARQVGIPVEQLREWYHDYQWLARARLYDKDIQGAQAHAVYDYAYDAARSRCETLAKLDRILENESQKLLERSCSDESLLTPHQIAKVLEIATKLRRLVDDKPTEIHGGGITVDTESLSAEELVELSGLLARGARR